MRLKSSRRKNRASERGKTREAEKRAGKRKERKGGTTVRKKSDGPRHTTADTFNEKPAAGILLPPAPWRTRSEIRAVSASGGRHPICRRPDRRDAPIGYARFACGPSRLKTAQERTRNSFFKPGAEPNAGSDSAEAGKRTRKKQTFRQAECRAELVQAMPRRGNGRKKFNAYYLPPTCRNATGRPG